MISPTTSDHLLYPSVAEFKAVAGPTQS